MIEAETHLAWDQRTVSKGDVTIAYRVAGEGPLYCLLPSTGRGGADFLHLGEALVAQGARVVLPDPRGIGASQGPMEGVSFLDLAGDAAMVVEAEGQGQKAVICGHAFGCWLARTLCQIRPDLARALVLIAAGGKSWDPALSRAIEVAMDPANPRDDRLAALQLAFFAKGHDPSPWLDGWHGPVVQMQRAAKKNTNRADWWDSGVVPILDLIAGDDPFRRPASYRDFSEEFGNRLTQAFIPGASHALPDEKPAEVSRVIVDWVSATSI